MMLVLAWLAAFVALATAHAGHEHSADKNLNATVVQAALSTLCSNDTNARGVMTGVPYDMGCAFLDACEPIVDLAAASADTAKSGSTNSSAMCAPNMLLATICAPYQEGPGPQNAACQPFVQLCTNSTSSTCEPDDLMDLPALNLTTYQTWDNVQHICAYHAMHLGLVFNGTVSMPDPAAGRRRLLHAGHAHDDGNDDGPHMGPAGLNNTGVPHSEAAHIYCNSCLKGSLDTATIAKTCPGGPMTSLSGLCSLSPMGTGNEAFDQLCDPWREFCTEYGGNFPSFCREWTMANQ